MKKTIYIYKSGELLRKDDSLVLKPKKGPPEYIPIEQVNLIMCFGDITLNKRTLGLLNSYRISVFFFNFYGTYIGQYVPKKYTTGKILTEQVNAAQTGKRLYIAKKMIAAGSENLLSVLRYYDKKRNDLRLAMYFIREKMEEIDSSPTVENLLTIEAQIKKWYYSCFDSIISDKDFSFEKRTFHPPQNEVNALLSYGYSLLYANVQSDIEKSPLDPCISFVHGMVRQGDSLQYDIADILKPFLVDRLVFRMINKHQLKPGYFYRKNDGRCFLNKEGVSQFLDEFEKLMQKSIKLGSKYYSYRNIITGEVYKLSDYISGKRREYEPVIFKRW